MYSLDVLYHLAALLAAVLVFILSWLWRRHRKKAQRTRRPLVAALISYALVFVGASAAANLLALHHLKKQMGEDAVTVAPEQRARVRAMESLTELCRLRRDRWTAATTRQAFKIIDEVVPALRAPLEASLVQCLVTQKHQRVFETEERARLELLAEASPGNLAKYDDVLRTPGTWRDVFALQGIFLWADRGLGSFDAVVTDAQISPHARREYVRQAARFCAGVTAAAARAQCAALMNSEQFARLRQEQVFRCVDISDLRYRYRLSTELGTPGCTEPEPMELFLFAGLIDQVASSANAGTGIN